MNLKKVGQAVVITAGVKLKDLQRVAKFAPKALQLVDAETKDVVFAVAANSETIGKYGVSFNKENTAGYAQMTFMVDANTTKEQLVENYGFILNNLAKVEEQVAESLELVAQSFAAITDSIEVE